MSMDIGRAKPLTTSGHYSGRIVKDPEGQWMLMTFLGTDDSGTFRGIISNPIPLRLDEHGYLTVNDDD